MRLVVFTACKWGSLVRGWGCGSRRTQRRLCWSLKCGRQANTSHRLSAWLPLPSAPGYPLCGEFWGPDATEVWVEAEILLCGDTEEAQGPGRLREDGGPAFLEHCPAGPDLPPGPHHSCSSTDQRGLGLCSPGALPLRLSGSVD